ncbi:NUDIX hydrolase [Undibacterium sp. TS12]|uniref:NUDIX hydrolase n=1 Tax=Undibacterium sp. TS12 TaxID=2908202 RepID=UPI001F4C8E51|nr:NUDIX hydrolase [Undibacterium sp. TS12]MCH8619712.1 NUDIX hydrolase [Undibacterium sp. TS12]
MQDLLITLLKAHQSVNATEENHRLHTLDFVSSTPACTNRDTSAGHITASAWILSPDGKAALLTHHKKLNRWLQLGGHLEDDPDIRAAAAREAREESGIESLQLLSDALFDVDVHPIPARKNEPEHYHYDLRFLFQSPVTEFRVSDESHDLAWVPLAQLVADGSNESVSRMARKTLPGV